MLPNRIIPKCHHRFLSIKSWIFFAHWQTIIFLFYRLVLAGSRLQSSYFAETAVPYDYETDLEISNDLVSYHTYYFEERLELTLVKPIV